MKPTPGVRLGNFEIVAKLGEGGMGEVWRARDSALGRDVALKVLPEAFSGHPERVARFEREARLLAQLNHPNVAHVYGFEVAGDQRALVMELVEGPTLAERLERGPVPVAEALALARQIAEGLEAAHEKGIVHRDLKPQNVKVSDEGTVKILDFGLAKVFDPTSSAAEAANPMDSPTLTSDESLERRLLGTAAYLSPEQAKGTAVDRRTDVWSFGVVLYETLTGRRLFAAPSTAETLARVLGGEIDWTPLPAATPGALRRLLRRCLERNPRNRLHDIADARLVLDELVAAPEPEARERSPLRPALTGRLAAAALAGALAAWGAAALVGWLRPGGGEPPPNGGAAPRRVELVGVAVVDPSNVAISPDGREIVAYDASSPRPQLVRRALDAFGLLPVPGTEDAFNPFFSPDGRSIGFFAREQLCVVGLDGSGRRCLAEALGFATGNWGAGGAIVYSSRARAGESAGGLWRLSGGAGAPERLTTVDVERGERVHTHPQILPDGRHVLFTLLGAQQSSVVAVPLAGGAPRQLVASAVRGRYLGSGHLAYFDEESARLAVAPFDLERLALAGPAVFFDTLLATPSDAIPAFEVSENGTLVYSSGTQSGDDFTLERVDRQGNLVPLVAERGSWAQPRVSPDGRLVLARRSGRPDCGFWLLDLERGVLQRVPLEGDNHNPLWLPDGKSFLTAHESGERRDRRVMAVALDGDAPPAPAAPVDFPALAESVSPDGRYLALTRDAHRGRNDILLFARESGTVDPLLDADYDEDLPAISPDGALLAFAADDSGRSEVYVRPFRAPGARHLVSTRGGTGPLWSRDGRELFYAEGTRMMRVAIGTAPRVAASEPSVLFDRPEIVWERPRNYDVLADGSGFVVVRRGPATPPIRSLRVVFDWFRELEQLAPATPR